MSGSLKKRKKRNCFHRRFATRRQLWKRKVTRTPLPPAPMATAMDDDDDGDNSEMEREMKNRIDEFFFPYSLLLPPFIFILVLCSLYFAISRFFFLFFDSSAIFPLYPSVTELIFFQWMILCECVCFVRRPCQCNFRSAHRYGPMPWIWIMVFITWQFVEKKLN